MTEATDTEIEGQGTTPPEEDWQKLLEQSRAQLQAAQAETAQARQETSAAREVAARAQGNAENLEAHAAGSEAQRYTAAGQAARERMMRARAAGDEAAEMTALDEMATARAAAVMAEDRAKSLKAYNEQSQAQRGAEIARQAAQPQPQTAAGYSTSAQAWINSHPRYSTDVQYRQTAIAAHGMAIESGIAPDSRAYFDFINRQLDTTYPDTQAGAATRRTPASSGGAPPARSAAAATSRDGTPDASAIARHLGMSVDDMRDGARIAGMPFDKYLKEHAAEMATKSGGGRATLRATGDSGSWS